MSEADEEPDDDPLSIFIPGGMLPIAEEEDEDEAGADEDAAAAALLAGVALAGAGGRVTATVLPPLPLLLDAAADEAAAAGAAEEAAAAGAAEESAAAVGWSVAVGEAEGEAAVEEVSFWDHSPISDNTPARTAIAMIAPITQDVLLVSPSPVSSGSPFSLFGFAIFAPVAMVYAEIVGLER